VLTSVFHLMTISEKKWRNANEEVLVCHTIALQALLITKALSEELSVMFTPVCLYCSSSLHVLCARLEGDVHVVC